MKSEIESFISSIPDFDEVARDRNDLLAHLGYFLSEVMDSPIKPATLAKCYEAAALPVPPRLDVVIPRSGKFVRGDDGYLLHRDDRQRIAAKIKGAQKTTELTSNAGVLGPKEVVAGAMSPKDRTVFVVHGRDEQLRNGLFQFLRALGLEPLEWSQLVRLTGKGSPYVGEVLRAGFEYAQAALVLLSPDEGAVLRSDLRTEPGDNGTFPQPRPNVMVEAGMALGMNEERTILVQIGSIRRITDLEGRHTVHLDNSPEKRNALAQRLEDAQCRVQRVGTDWLSVGKFYIKAPSKPTSRKVK